MLEAGHPIAIGLVDEPSVGIDTPEDYRRFVARWRARPKRPCDRVCEDTKDFGLAAGYGAELHDRACRASFVCRIDFMTYCSGKLIRKRRRHVRSSGEAT